MTVARQVMAGGSMGDAVTLRTTIVTPLVSWTRADFSTRPAGRSADQPTATDGVFVVAAPVTVIVRLASVLAAMLGKSRDAAAE